MLAWFAGAATFAAEVRDDAGTTVGPTAAVRRIVTLAPHATELLFAIGAGDRIVGADEYSDHPPAARSIPRVGRAGALDVERIAALRPDLVVAWGSGNSSAQVTALRRLGLRVFVSEPRRLEDIATTLRRFGALTGESAAAAAEATDFDGRLAELRRRHAGKEPVSVFYQIWDRPMMTVNGQHLISAAIELCGGRNVFAVLPQLAAGVDVEAVLRADPQAIVGSGADAARPAWLDHWRRWPQLTAARTGNLFDIPPELIQRQGLRLADGIERLCGAIDTARGRLYSGK